MKGQAREKAGRRGITFCPKARGTAAARLEAFVAHARHRSTLLGADLPFQEDTWDLTDRIPGRKAKPSRPNRRCIRFARAARRGTEPVPMRPPVRDFAKAYVRQTKRVDVNALRARLDAVRLLDEVLAARGLDTMAQVTPAILDAAADLAKRRHAASTAAKASSALEILSDFLALHELTDVTTAGWRGVLQAPQPVAGSCGAGFEENQAARLPTPEFVKALGASFRLATEKRDVIVTSCAALLISAPKRVGEVLDVDEDCDVWVSRGGRTYLALRWNGLKGSGQYLKWIPEAMVPVVARALERLRAATAPARLIKKWYDRNPTELYLPPHLSHLRGREVLGFEELGDIVGIAAGPTLHDYVRENGIEMAVPAGPGPGGPARRVGFAAIERHILGQLSDSMARAGGCGARPLMLVERHSFMRRDQAGCPCMFDTVRYGAIALLLKPAPGRRSMFQRLGIDPDGTTTGRSHSLRHYLCTLAEAGGLSQEDIREFRGGVNPYHNKAYDHVPNAFTRVALEGLSAAICAAAGGTP